MGIQKQATINYGAAAVAQEGSQIRSIKGMTSAKLSFAAVSSGTFKVYLSDNYGDSSVTARWIPVPCFDTLGVRVAADTAVTPLTTKDVYVGCENYTHIKITEQNAGTFTCKVDGSQESIAALMALFGVSITTDIAITDDAAYVPGTGKGVAVFGMADETAPDSVDEGDAGALRMTLDRKLITSADRVDDAAFTPATHYVSVIGAFADETAPDSVDEGDAGALRMTLDRKLITATELVDDAAFTPGTSYVSVVGAQADETSPDSVNEGDAGALRMTLDRRLLVETTNGTIRQPSIDSYTHVAINLTTGADQVLAAGVANKQIWVYGFGLSVGDAAGQTVSFQDEDNVALSGIMEFAQYGGMAVAPSGNFAMPLWKLGTDKDLEVDITGGDVDGWLTYAVVSV